MIKFSMFVFLYLPLCSTKAERFIRVSSRYFDTSHLMIIVSFELLDIFLLHIGTALLCKFCILLRDLTAEFAKFFKYFRMYMRT